MSEAMRRRILPVLAIAILGAPQVTQGAWSPRVRPGQKLHIGVEQLQLPGFPGYYTAPPGSNTLRLGGTAGYFRLSGVTLQLYEGPTLVASLYAPEYGGLTSAFVTPSSPWGLGPTAVIDFTSLLAGNFRGQLVVIPYFSAPDGYYEINPEFVVGQANDFNSFVAPGKTLYSGGSRVSRIPEPSSIVLGLLAAGGTVCLARKSGIVARP